LIAAARAAAFGNLATGVTPMLPEIYKRIPTADAHVEISKYIDRIRNTNKRNYARAYWSWIKRDDQTDPPEPHGLGTMAAQAVRMNIHVYAPFHR
jgi:hypothetical protein